MEVFFYILISTFLVSLIAFVGIIILFLKEKFLDKILLILVAFAAGSFLGSSFLHLLPEAVERIGTEEESLLKLFLFFILGFSTFYILENLIGWHHHHTKDHSEIGLSSFERIKEEHLVKPIGYLILISDGIHNFIDGLIIASSYVVSLPLGIATTLAVAFHEIPQEIGDFGVLVYSGFKKTRALVFNFLSGILAILGGFAGFLLSGIIEGSIVFLLPFAAGVFTYIASSDLVPEIKSRANHQRVLLYFFVFLAGITLMFALKLFGE